MAKNVAEGLWEMLASAGVRRCYGIVGDALNPVIDALRRNGSVDFIHVRHEEYGVFAAVAEARLTGHPVAVCGTAGPGVTHLINGLLDARKERAPVIAIAGDVHLGRPAHRVRPQPPAVRLVHLGVHGQRRAGRLRRRAVLPRPAGHRLVRGRRLHHARAGRPADPGPAQGPRRERHLQQRHAGLRQHRAAGSRLRPLRDRFRGPGLQPGRHGARRPRHPRRGARRRTQRPRAALAHTGGPVVVDVVVDRYALALPSHVPATTAQGFTLSMAKQVLSGKMDEVIETVKHNVRLL